MIGLFERCGCLQMLLVFGAALLLATATPVLGAQTAELTAAPTAAEIGAIIVPDLRFTPGPLTAQDFEKYFFFHRKNTDFLTALADIRECDNFARGIAFHTAYVPAPYGYGVLPSAIGGAIGNMIADAIYGSAQRRLTRRVNLRTCMGYKEYDRYGLPHELWQKFNFEEGLRPVSDAERTQFLMQQAKIASGPTPKQGELSR